MAHRVALLAVVVLLGACSDEAPPAAEDTGGTGTTCPAAGDQTDVPYVEDGDPLQRLDLYLPDAVGCAPVPLVVWVHGGGWRTGDKANAMDPKVRLWNDAGWAVASVNYRLTDVRAPAADQVVAPAHNEDVAAALAWLVTHRTELGVDRDRIALLGHSAGAGITAALAADPTYLAAHGLDPSALTCAAPLDTEGFDIEAVVAGGGPLASLYRSVFGTDPARWRELSPLAHVGDAPIPDLFLVRRGEAARRAQVDAFADAARRSGAEVTVIDLPGFSHADVNKRIGDPVDTDLTPALQELLTGCLSG